MTRGRFFASLLTALLGARFACLLGVEEVKEVPSHAWPSSPVTDEQIEDAVIDLRAYERDILYGTGSMEPPRPAAGR